MKKYIFIILLILVSFVTVSCGKRRQFEYDENKINVVVTTTILNDILLNLGGSEVSVYSLMETGVDPHSYIGRPSDVSSLKKADLIIYNGLNLEANLILLINSFDNNKVINVGSFYPENKLLSDEDGAIDPHIWFDVINFRTAIYGITNKLIEIDPNNESYYKNNYYNYSNELNLLTAELDSLLYELPEEKRILITAHDAFQYFGRAYNFEVNAIQGISTAAQASPKDIQDLANLIVRKNVKAIFLEASIPEQTIQSVINAVRVQGKSVSIGGTLYADSLGSSNDSNTYIKMIRHNMITIVSSLK